MSKLNIGQGETFKIKMKKIAVELHVLWTTQNLVPGEGALPIMAYTVRLRPKGVPFSIFRYIKG